MNLREATIKRLYFLDADHPYEFYRELYRCSSEIIIALGYFSGSAFGLGAEGLLDFLKREGTIKILCNDKLYKPDIDAITAGYDLKNHKNITLADIEELFNNIDEFEQFGFKCLSFLIAASRLEIKILRSTGLVHFKIGVASDSKGNNISFEGSVNYTISGLIHNNEQLHITKSWNNSEDSSFVQDIKSKISILWEGKNNNFEVIDGETIKDLISEHFPPRDITELETEYLLLEKKLAEIRNSIINLNEKKGVLFFNFPSSYKPRDYQIEAINNWEKHNFKTLFAMATGTGKTLTALFAINTLYFNKPNLTFILIVVPLKDLVNQWFKDIEPYFNGDIIRISSGNPNWFDQLRSAKIKNVGMHSPTVIVCTYQSYGLHNKRILDQLQNKRTIIIADEVHRFGSESLKALLPNDIDYRIGLSATPEREFDAEGTEAIYNYFCPHDDPFVMTIKDAIDREILCPYYYHPILVNLTDGELADYCMLTEKIRKLSRNDDDKISKSKPNETLTLLLKKRHRIIEQAYNKLNSFIELLDQLHKEGKTIEKAIVYVPEGKKEGKELINEYSHVLWKTYGIMTSKYVQGSKSKLLDNFRKGYTKVLVAKKRLDEGVDIPEVKQAFFIASSTVQREFVQRRGRILRKSKNKDYAEIFDFLIVPPSNYDIQISEHDVESIKKGELKRAKHFAENALNKYDALQKLNPYI